MFTNSYNPYYNPYSNNGVNNNFGVPNNNFNNIGNNNYNNANQNQSPTTNMSWVKVQTIQQVKDAQNQANTTIWYMHNGGEWISCKAVDSMGIPTIKAWKVSEISTDNQETVSSDFATKKELIEVKNEIDCLKSSLKSQKCTKKEC